MNAKSIFATAVAGTAAFLLLRKKQDPELEPDENLQINVYDSDGNVISRMSMSGHVSSGQISDTPLVMSEGGDYSFDFSVTNASTRRGIPWAASLTMVYTVETESGIIDQGGYNESFEASETKSFGPIPFTIPWETEDQTIIISVVVKSPAGDTLDYGIVSGLVEGTPVEAAAVLNSVWLQREIAGAVHQPDTDGNGYIDLEEDYGYGVHFSVTNESTRGGVPWPLEIIVESVISGPSWLNHTYEGGWAMEYAAGQTRENVTTKPGGGYTIRTLWDTGGDVGSVTVYLKDTQGNVLDSETIQWEVIGTPIDYGADVDL